MESPLANKTFRLLWASWLVAHMCLWMNDVGAAWTMTALSGDPFLVALVQTASTLPIFVLGLPVGALADRLDRRRFFAFTQWWAAVVAALLALTHALGLLTPTLLLALVLANGIGLAMRMPVFAALVPSALPREQLRPAIAMTSIAANVARIAGPLVAGALLAAAGPFSVYALNAVLCSATALLLTRWKFTPAPRPAPPPYFQAIAEGARYAWRSPMMRLILTHSTVFFFQGIVVIALLPVIASSMHDAGPAGYGMLLAGMGTAAIATGMAITRLSRQLGLQNLIRIARVAHACGTLLAGFAPNLWLAVFGMMLTGFGWVAAGNSWSATLQLRLPDEVRARGMSIYQMAVMGSCAGGAALWGQVVSLTSLHTGLLCAVLVAAVLLLFTHRFKLPPLERGVTT